MRLPPFGKDFQPVPASGVRVVIGRTAWRFAENHHAPIMVLPDGDKADQYRWPSDGMPALIHERGEYNDDALDELAGALLRTGSPSVIAIRESLLDDFDPRVFYDAEVLDAAA